MTEGRKAQGNMSRIQENKEMMEIAMKMAKEKPTGTFEELVTFHLATIATMLADISKSLAILADSAKREET